MNKQETAEAIIVMQAFVNGEEIESTSAREEWHPIIESVWNWDDCEYRIKPKPSEVYLHINRKTGKVVGWNHKSETMHQDPKIIHKLFREVLNDG